MKTSFLTRHTPLISRLSLALGLFVVITIAFGLVADEVQAGNTLPIDRALLLAINAHSSPMLNTLFIIITQFGSVAVVGVLTTLVTGYLLYRRYYYQTFLLVAAVAGAGLLDAVMKLLFQRARPELWDRLITEINFSFPSGHAMGSSALAYAIVAILWPTRWRWPAIILGGIYVVTIGFSRLYLGVHYPTDIVGGWLLSLAWVLVVSIIVYRWMHRPTRWGSRLERS